MFSYTVIATFEDPRIAEEWIAWLREGHLKEVCAAGAIDAEVIRFDMPAAVSDTTGYQHVRCEVRYHFATRGAFETYVRHHAPRLREERLRRFPPERGINYERATGEVAARHPHA
jgi:hypothetical protein